MKRILKGIKNSVKKFYLRLTQVYYILVGFKVECNICHFKANKFNSDSWHLHNVCPYCGSDIRHRLVWASLTLLNDFHFDKIIKGKKVLHFAPEDFLSKPIKENAAVYKTADFLTENYSYNTLDYIIDISDMQEIKNESFNCVIAFDVLTHVPDCIGGIKEVFRVLNLGGYCIFTVPQKDDLTTTFEDLSITDSNERTKAFGGPDHLRIFGSDFTDTLKNCGFEVTAVDESFFKKETAEKYVLFPEVLSTHPFATNYRKVFFGKKV